ncbi:amidohydrolase family protein [Streptomyces aurantiacus]|uniref:amidohydrolase family protein n=1 Tax=Streptomyces aurantiacus TaxID=47760 RepID=UPI000AE1A1DC|nr:amidohydrolase family protein [Streptomyces aurantiacus]
METKILRGGRVIDPASGTEVVADVVVRGGQVSAVSPVPVLVPDATVIDVSGCVVGPGIVDLHSHVHSIAGQRLQAFDGVTTNLDLEAGLMPVGRAYAQAAAAGRVLNYGFSASWAEARGQVLTGAVPTARFDGALALLGNPDWQRDSSPAELAQWLDLLERELAAGALGIGVLQGYAPRSDPAEYLAVARLAGATGAPTFTHVRELVEADPSTPIDGSREVTCRTPGTKDRGSLWRPTPTAWAVPVSARRSSPRTACGSPGCSPRTS